MNNDKNQPKKRGKQLRQVAVLSGIAFQLAIITGIGAFVGFKLDERLQTQEPICTILGTFIGFALAMYGVVKQINKITK